MHCHLVLFDSLFMCCHSSLAQVLSRQTFCPYVLCIILLYTAILYTSGLRWSPENSWGVCCGASYRYGNIVSIVAQDLTERATCSRE
jgi:hypothetical protein